MERRDMKELNLRCKLITPMFMAGSDKETTELRPTEFKGMMRWWWRAIKAEDNIQKLKKEEAEIFGSIEKEGKSKLYIRILTELNESDKIDYQLLPHHKRNYCTIDEKINCKKAFERKAVKPEKEIQIVFFVTQENLYWIENLIYLAFILGGFGKRSRRGFGSFEIIYPKKEIKSLNDILILLNGINNGRYEIANSKIINNVQAIINKKIHQLQYPWIQEIILSNREFRNYNEFLEFIGNVSHKYKDPSLGNANPRMASPVYVSGVITKGKLKPIITILNPVFPKNYPECNFNEQKNFIKELVNE